MTDSRENNPFGFDVGARADAKFEIKGTVPERSLGRFVDALTDIIRPFSESRGLRADQIRLQREDVAVKIARKAKEKVAIENAEIKPVSNKLLVPLLEYSSLEDINDDYMISKWANLLASAAMDTKVPPLT